MILNISLGCLDFSLMDLEHTLQVSVMVMNVITVFQAVSERKFIFLQLVETSSRN